MDFSRNCVAAAVSALNTGGRALQRFGIDAPGLELESLKRSARRRAGLADFGAWNLDEPLDRLLDSYRLESRLTTLGRITVREMIVSLLENLLHLEDDRARDDTVEQIPIRQPIFIIGLPRTGTLRLT